MRRFAYLVAASLGVLALVAGPVSAADTDTTLTLTSSGTLDITVPASTVNLGSTAVPAAADTYTTTAGDFGTVTVTDSRATSILDGNLWQATATGTDFCIDQDATAAGTQCHADDLNQKILGSAITYTPGAPTANLGDVSLVTTTPGTLAVGATVTYTAVSGSSEVSWQPTLAFTLSGTHVAGTYAGTISHSVS